MSEIPHLGSGVSRWMRNARESGQFNLAKTCYNQYERPEAFHEAVSDLCGLGAAARRVPAAAGEHPDVRLLDPHRLVGGRKAVRGLRHEASVRLSVRHPAGSDARRGG